MLLVPALVTTAGLRVPRAAVRERRMVAIRVVAFRTITLPAPTPAEPCTVTVARTVDIARIDCRWEG
jgi:hypothetical protein